jgi:oligopeptide transport system permease protein
MQILHLFVRKFLRMGAILFGVTLITFLLMHAIPGNPWANYASSPRMLLGLVIDQTTQKQLTSHFGLDLPLWRQFTRYFFGDFNEDGSLYCGAVCGNLGPSIRQRGSTVWDVLFKPPEGKTFWQSRFGYSIRLVLLSSLLAVGIGIPLGILSAVRPKSRLSRAISVGLAALVSIPNFVLGLLAIIILASWLHLIQVLPDWDIPAYWLLPAIVLAAMPLATTARVTHTSLVNIANEDYIRTARAKGLTQARVILVHMLRNALVPIITFLGPTLMELFTGLFIVENLFSFPGFGREYWQAVLALDYPVILGLTLFYAIGIVFLNALVEIICAGLDPRIRLLQRQGVP